ncbi:hypothetical protein BD779DRAFT_1505192 [Infundibulicybe gibba]|nr:hypothetical protein BD779DRAFT_1505192 [Infundibulicybe gibba]
MAAFTLLVEDCSPLVSYRPPGAWADTPNDDSSAISYSGATATLEFNGTGISIFGGQHGKNIATGSAQSANSAFNKTLGQVLGLPNGAHSMVFTSASNAPVDIDYVNIETQIGNPSQSSTLSETTYDDNDPQITYSGSWRSNSGPDFINNTLHFTQNPGDSASLSFSGDAVAVYGTMSPDHADIQMLWMAGFVFTGTGPFVDLDSVTVFSAHVANNNPVSGNSPTSNTQQFPCHPQQEGKGFTSAKASSSSSAPVIGAVVGGLAGLALLLALSLLFLRWRRHRKPKFDKFLIHSPVTPVLPMQWGPDMMEAGFVRITPDTSSTNSLAPLPPAAAHVRHSITPSYGNEASHLDIGHSRHPSALSQESTAPMLPEKDLPIIRIPRPPAPSRLLMPIGSNFTTVCLGCKRPNGSLIIFDLGQRPSTSRVRIKSREPKVVLNL